MITSKTASIALSRGDVRMQKNFLRKAFSSGKTIPRPFPYVRPTLTAIRRRVDRDEVPGNIVLLVDDADVRDQRQTSLNHEGHERAANAH